MKRQLAALALCLALCSSNAYAQAPAMDLASMTPEQLHALVDQARTALMEHEIYLDSDKVILDEQGVKVVLRADHEVRDDIFKATLIVENNSDKKIAVSPEEVYVNGWLVSGLGVSDLAPGKKAEGELFISPLSSAQVTTAEDLEDLEFVLKIVDAEQYMVMFTSQKISIQF